MPQAAGGVFINEHGHDRPAAYGLNQSPCCRPAAIENISIISGRVLWLTGGGVIAGGKWQHLGDGGQPSCSMSGKFDDATSCRHTGKFHAPFADSGSATGKYDLRSIPWR